MRSRAEKVQEEANLLAVLESNCVTAVSVIFVFVAKVGRGIEVGNSIGELQREAYRDCLLPPKNSDPLVPSQFSCRHSGFGNRDPGIICNGSTAGRQFMRLATVRVKAESPNSGSR